MQSVDQWMMADGGTFLAAGIDGAATGFGANLLLVDDPVRSREDANSALIREQAWSAFNNDLRTRLMPNGVIVRCMTRWHLDDVVGRLVASPEGATWTVLRLPAIAEDEDPLLACPAKHPGRSGSQSRRLRRQRKPSGPCPSAHSTSKIPCRPPARHSSAST
jgi:hypothetical protein